MVGSGRAQLCQIGAGRTLSQDRGDPTLCWSRPHSRCRRVAGMPVRIVDVVSTITAYEMMTGNYTRDCWCVAASDSDS